MFLRNLLLNENNHLSNRTLHIKWKLNDSKNVNIDQEKVNIETITIDINHLFSDITASHVSKLFHEFEFQIIFGRSDVQKILNLKPTRCTLLKEMLNKEIIEEVIGKGKGKYRFKQK